MLSRRGAGLGNEVFPWAKAYIAARELHCRTVLPPWRLNPRRYDRLLPRATGSIAAYGAATSLPRRSVGEDEFLHSGHADYAAFLRAKVLGTVAPYQGFEDATGMAGGYLAIASARPYLGAMLLGSRSGIAGAVALQHASEARLRIAVHVRSGDFGRARSDMAGRFNVATSMSWYLDATRAVVRGFGGPVAVFVLGDASACEALRGHLGADVDVRAVDGDALHDLSVMAHADLLVTSVSSYSMLAAFLGGQPYLWCGPQLTAIDEYLSIWGGEPQGAGPIRTRAARIAEQQSPTALARGVAFFEGDRLSPGLVERLRGSVELRRASGDLLLYGVSPIGSGGR